MYRKIKEVINKLILLYERLFNWSVRELILPYITTKYGPFFLYINAFVVAVFWMYVAKYDAVFFFTILFYVTNRNSMMMEKIKNYIKDIYAMHTYMDMFIYSFVLLGICALLIGICYYKKKMYRKIKEVINKLILLYERLFNWSVRELILPYITTKYGPFFLYINAFVVAVFWMYVAKYDAVFFFTILFYVTNRNSMMMEKIKNYIKDIYSMHTYMDMFIYSFVLLGICALLIGICYYKKTMYRKIKEVINKLILLYERWFNWSVRELILPYITTKYGPFFLYINAFVVAIFWMYVAKYSAVFFLTILFYVTNRNSMMMETIKNYIKDIYALNIKTSLVGVIRYYMHTYMDMFIYSFLLLGICALLIGICYLLSMNNLYFEKLTGYECGFDPFSDARDPFNIKFYLISIIFIIFDVEAIFFLPWLICQNNLLYIGYYVMYLFYLILVLGFFYEWRKGTIDWD